MFTVKREQNKDAKINLPVGGVQLLVLIDSGASCSIENSSTVSKIQWSQG